MLSGIANSEDPDRTAPDLGLHCFVHGILLETVVFEILGHLLYLDIFPFQEVPIEDLKKRCLEQVEVMSKKRIRRILAGREMPIQAFLVLCTHMDL